MEQERKIEKWLRAYAKKRRGQAGEAFKLDPARRRLLQSEISRSNSGSARPSEDDGEAISLWEMLRRRWMFLLGFAACVFVFAMFLFQTFYRSKPVLGSRELAAKKTTHVVSPNQKLMESRALVVTNGVNVAFLDKTAAPMAMRVKLPPPVQSEKIKGPVSGQKAAPLSAGTLALARPVPVAGASSVSGTAGERSNGSTTGELAKSDELAAASEPPVMPPSSGIPAGAPAGGVGGGAGFPSLPIPSQQSVEPAGAGMPQSFAGSRKIQSITQNTFVNTSVPRLPYGPVLRNFQVFQDGNLIRVVDGDGSVYKGKLERRLVRGAPAGAADESPSNSKFESPKLDQSQLQSQRNSGPPAGVAGAAPLSENASGYTFRVAGMNRTLKQAVRFSGTLLQDLAVANDVQQSFGMGANMALGAGYAQQLLKSARTNQAQLPWSKLRIRGTATINGTNHMEINAAPAAIVKGSGR